MFTRRSLEPSCDHARILLVALPARCTRPLFVKVTKRSFFSPSRVLSKSPLTPNHGIPDERHPLKLIQIRECPASERTQAPLVIETHPLIVRARHIGRVYRGAVVRDERTYDRRWLGN